MPSPAVQWWADEACEGQAADRGRRLLADLLQLPVEVFEERHWLQQPYVRHMSPRERAEAQDNPRHWMHMLSLRQVQALLRRTHPRPARWLHDVDATRYVDGRRMALAEGAGDVDVAATWQAFRREGYSLRLVHPQQWHRAAYELCAHLQEYFGFPVGCSSYLTPAATQGFPPHYDDVEIFVLQLEGRKRWRLYHRPDEGTAPSPRVTTEFSQAALGEPFRELVLEAGDVMYFPRGVVHQAVADPTAPSLHLTFSTYQRHTWRDLLALALAHDTSATAALSALAAEGPGWVHSDLPLDIMATPSAGHPAAAWERWGGRLIPPRVPMHLTRALRRPGVLGRGIDRLCKAFLTNSLPPPPPPRRQAPARETVTLATGKLDAPPLTLGCSVRLAAPWCARLVDESHGFSEVASWGKADAAPQLVLYTNAANGRSLEAPASPAFEVLPELGSRVLALLAAGHAGMRVGVLLALRNVAGVAEREGDGDRGGGDAEGRGGQQAGVAGDLEADLLDLLDLLLEHGVITRV